ncbi:MAG: hypothetical protein LBP40_08555 [Campylobacteraceae bacterium]|nr:hypothetical protein [Campylobacteraceae bacterium]
MAALALMWGCNSEQTQTSENLLMQSQTSNDLEIVEYEDFTVEYDREKLIVNFILKNDEGVQ